MALPNILFCIADDASHFGIDGWDFVQTPNIDRIGKSGVHFKGMYTTNPKCAPSRASILTGMHTWQLKEAASHWNVFPGADEVTVYPDILEQHGYHVGFTGKGWGPGDYQRRGRERNPAGPRYNEKHLEAPEGSCVSKIDYAENFKDFLKDKADDEPFYFWFGCIEPHRPYAKGEGRKHGKNPDEINEVPPYWPDTAEVREDMADYAFEIEWFDDQVGLMLKHLEEIGELEQTLIIVTSDNGCPFPRVKGNMYEDDFRLPCVAMWGNHLSGVGVSDALCSFTDFAPTFLDVAGIEKEAYGFYGKSLLDVFDGKPLKRDKVMMGRERHDMGREGDVGYPVRCLRTPEYLYVRNFEPNRWPAGDPVTGYTDCDSSPTKREVLRLEEEGQTEFHRLCFGKRPLEELYCMKEDPYCLVNLALDSSYDTIKNECWQELKQGLLNSSDPRMAGKGEWFEQVEYVGGATHSWAHYQAGDWKEQTY